MTGEEEVEQDRDRTGMRHGDAMIEEREGKNRGSPGKTSKDKTRKDNSRIS